MDDACPNCGEKHDRLFSDRVLDVFRDLEQATDPDERRQLMVELGTEFALDVSADDVIFPETVHALVDEVVKERLVYEQSAARMARLIMDAVAKEADERDHDEAKVETDSDRKPN